jgi:hypothetical protein
MITGRYPFHGVSAMGITLRIANGQRPDRPPGLPPGLFFDLLWKLIELCWAQEPTERPVMTNVIQRLHQALDVKSKLASDNEVMMPELPRPLALPGLALQAIDRLVPQSSAPFLRSLSRAATPTAPTAPAPAPSAGSSSRSAGSSSSSHPAFMTATTLSSVEGQPLPKSAGPPCNPSPQQPLRRPGVAAPSPFTSAWCTEFGTDKLARVPAHDLAESAAGGQRILDEVVEQDEDGGEGEDKEVAPNTRTNRLQTVVSGLSAPSSDPSSVVSPQPAPHPPAGQPVIPVVRGGRGWSFDDSPNSTVIALPQPTPAPAVFRNATTTSFREHEKRERERQERQEKDRAARERADRERADRERADRGRRDHTERERKEREDRHRQKEQRHAPPPVQTGPDTDSLHSNKDSLSGLGKLIGFDDAGILSPLLETKPGLPLASAGAAANAMLSLGDMANAMQSLGDMANAMQSASGAAHASRPTHARAASRSHTPPFAHGSGSTAADVAPPSRMTASSSTNTDGTVRQGYPASGQPSPYDREPPYNGRELRSVYDAARAPPSRTQTYDAAMLERKTPAPVRPPSRQAASYEAAQPLAPAAVLQASPNRAGTYDTSPSRPEASAYASRYATASGAAAAPVAQGGYESNRYDCTQPRSHSQRPSISASTMASASAAVQRSPNDATSPISPPPGSQNGYPYASGSSRYGTASRDSSPADPEARHTPRSSQERERPDIAGARAAYPHRPTESRPPVSSSAVYASKSAQPAFVSRSVSSARPPSSSSRYDSNEPKASSTTPRSTATSPYSSSSYPYGSQPAAGAPINGYSPSQQSARSRGSGSSHRTTSSGSYNAMPAPPQPVGPPSARASAAAASPSRRRMGFWNSRGDHLADGTHVVYAPREFANPTELADYPSPSQGFLDHNGQFIKAGRHFAELDDSLPHHGRAPRRPYPSVSLLSAQNI